METEETLPLLNWVVVVVDDEEDNAEVAGILLEQYGATVHVAYNAPDALALIRKLRPKLIVSDLSMPGMDGWTLIEQLKQDRATLEIPIVALTAHSMPGDRERAIRAGFHNYLTKPLTPANFLNDLMRVLTDIPQFAAELALYNSAYRPSA